MSIFCSIGLPGFLLAVIISIVGFLAVLFGLLIIDKVRHHGSKNHTLNCETIFRFTAWKKASLTDRNSYHVLQPFSIRYTHIDL